MELPACGLALLLAALCALQCDAAVVRFKECNTSKGKVGVLHSVDVEPCPGAPVGCKLVRGTSPTITITFTANKASDNVTAVVHGIIGGLPVPFLLPNPDGCQDSGMQCPVHAGKKYSYRQQLPIKTVYPKVSAIVQWELRDDDGADFMCMRIRTAIADP